MCSLYLLECGGFGYIQEGEGCGLLSVDFALCRYEEECSDWLCFGELVFNEVDSLCASYILYKLLFDAISEVG